MKLSSSTAASPNVFLLSRGIVCHLLCGLLSLATVSVASAADAPQSDTGNATPPTPTTTAPAAPSNPIPNAPNNNPAGTTSEAREVAPDTTPTAPVAGSPSTSTPQEATETAPSEGVTERAFKAGVDLFYGVSNLPGARRFRDGFWIGYGPAYPSVVYGRWETPKGSAAKVAVGVGKLYNGSVANVDQPVEAWYQRPLGSQTVTVGKFYVPFALQEWQYETKWGVQLAGKAGKADYVVSANHNHNVDAVNVYGRVSQALTKNITLGLSLGGGQGFSFDSVHDRGIGLDATAEWRGWQLNSEYVVLQRRAQERFQFAFAKLAYTRLGRLTPFISRHTWFDRAGELGNFNNSAAGLAYQLTPTLAVEGAFARGGGQSVRWIQAHYTAER